jgi:four helix bundle protein
MLHANDMGVQAEELKARAKRFALNTMRMIEELPWSRANDYLGSQLLRSANGVASNYRAACRARSRPEFAAKIGIVAEEADESTHWLEILTERGVRHNALPPLTTESRELEAIFSASYGTARRNCNRERARSLR